MRLTDNDDRLCLALLAVAAGLLLSTFVIVWHLAALRSPSARGDWRDAPAPAIHGAGASPHRSSPEDRR